MTASQYKSPHPANGFNGIEKLNRENFRACLNAMARPGTRQKIEPLFDSPLLAMASVLLYAEVSFFYRGRIPDFKLIKAMTGASEQQAASCDYLFADQPDSDLLERAYPGSMDQPESSTTCIFACPNTEKYDTMVRLKGPGIDGVLETSLPTDSMFAKRLTGKKHPFPKGIDLYLVTGDSWIIGLPRTTTVEVAS